MIRQARSYLVGAVSGTTLVAVAVVAFVALVSVQTLRDWPLAGLVGGGEAEPTEARTAGPQGATAGSSSGGAGAGSAAGAESGRAGPSGDGGGSAAAGIGAPVDGPTSGSAGPDAPVSSSGGGGGDSDRAGSGGGSQQPAVGGGGGGPASETVNGAVDDAVKGVDEPTGGALGETGVTKTTEDVVDGVVGTDSTGGKTVDDTVDEVNGTGGGLPGEGQ